MWENLNNFHTKEVHVDFHIILCSCKISDRNTHIFCWLVFPITGKKCSRSTRRNDETEGVDQNVDSQYDCNDHCQVPVLNFLRLIAKQNMHNLLAIQVTAHSSENHSYITHIPMSLYALLHTSTWAVLM